MTSNPTCSACSAPIGPTDLAVYVTRTRSLFHSGCHRGSPRKGAEVTSVLFGSGLAPVRYSGGVHARA
jgi:hypothetical protein